MPAKVAFVGIPKSSHFRRDAAQLLPGDPPVRSPGPAIKLQDNWPAKYVNSWPGGAKMLCALQRSRMRSLVPGMSVLSGQVYINAPDQDWIAVVVNPYWSCTCMICPPVGSRYVAFCWLIAKDWGVPMLGRLMAMLCELGGLVWGGALCCVSAASSWRAACGFGTNRTGLASSWRSVWRWGGCSQPPHLSRSSSFAVVGGLDM